jgi:hypothetical protein
MGKAHTRQEAEVEDVVRALATYGVLTRAGLADICGAAHWTDPGFRMAIARAISSGRIRPLGDELYEICEPRPPLATAADVDGPADLTVVRTPV